MQYLFFDIECANCDGGNGKICSFGYVLTDENFNEIEKDDIIIDPKAPFHLRGWGKKTYIELAYPQEVFLAAPVFSEFYDRIKSLLTDGDKMVFGYAPENDAGFLRSEFERYGLLSVNFTFYDVQRIYKYAEGSENGNLISLSGACEKLEIDTEFITHKSCDDAYATMLVLKKLCENKKMTASEIVERFTPCKGELKDGDVLADYFKPKPEVKPGEENLIKGANKDIFRYVVRKCSNLSERGYLKGKKICFSWLYEYTHFGSMVVLVRDIFASGGKYTHRINDCDIFVKKPEGMRGTCKRLMDAEEMRERNGGKRPEIYTFDEFLALMRTSDKKLRERAKNSAEIISEIRAASGKHA